MDMNSQSEADLILPRRSEWKVLAGTSVLAGALGGGSGALIFAPLIKRSALEFLILEFLILEVAFVLFGFSVGALGAKLLQRRLRLQRTVLRVENLIFGFIGIISLFLAISCIYNSIHSQNATLLLSCSFFGTTGLICLYFAGYLGVINALIGLGFFSAVAVVRVVYTGDGVSLMVDLAYNAMAAFALIMVLKRSAGGLPPQAVLGSPDSGAH